MSHFSVLAIQKAKHNMSLEELLGPYDENLEADPRVYKTKKELIDEEKENISKILTNSTVQEYLADPVKFKEEESEGTVKWVERLLDKHYKVAAGSFTDEDYYQMAIEDRDPEEFDEDGNLLTTYNEDSKWDWYQVGGRWSDELILKDGTRVNSAKVKDLDWAAMNKLDPDQEQYIRDLWRIYVEKKATKKETEEFLEEHPQWYKEEYYKDRYGSVEDHIKEAALYSTFAVVDEDGWHEQGEMGWFGMSSETPEEAKDWTKNFGRRFIENLDPEDVVTMVDCHI